LQFLYLLSIQSLQICLTRNLLSNSLNINLGIILYHWLMGSNLLLDQSILCKNSNFAHFENTLMRISEKDSSVLPPRLQVHLFSLQRTRMVPFAFVWIIEVSMLLLSKIDILYHSFQNSWTDSVNVTDHVAKPPLMRHGQFTSLEGLRVVCMDAWV